MTLSLRRGTVTAVVERHEGLARIEVDGAPCVAYPRVTGPVALGDDVLVNVQARQLGLGSGGFDIVYANLTRGLQLEPAASAHVMTLPYTPLQHAVVHAEEEGTLAPSLDGMPVICCSLHSQLAPVCAGLGRAARAAYVQIAGGALPVSLSDAVRVLQGRGLLEVTVAAAPCHDAEVQCANIASAFAWVGARGYDAIVCAIGPGIVGTGSDLGHGALAAADAANAASALQGSPIVAVRYSDADPRERHRGVSHHTRAVLRLCLGDPVVAWPAGLAAPTGLAHEEVDVGGWRDACEGLPLDHMGRGPEEDPWFFASAFAAGRLARRLIP
jgi:Protein of unknown function (DUF3866)